MKEAVAKNPDFYELWDPNNLKNKMFNTWKDTDIKFATEDSVNTMARNLRWYIDIIIRRLIEKARQSTYSEHLVHDGLERNQIGVMKYQVAGHQLCAEPYLLTIWTNNPKVRMICLVFKKQDPEPGY